MYHELLHDATFWAFLFSVDRDLAESCRAEACPSCGGRLHRADYPCKPRGGPRSLPEEYRFRLSFCCARDGYRKRKSPYRNQASVEYRDCSQTPQKNCKKIDFFCRAPGVDSQFKKHGRGAPFDDRIERAARRIPLSYDTSAQPIDRSCTGRQQISEQIFTSAFRSQQCPH